MAGKVSQSCWHRGWPIWGRPKRSDQGTLSKVKLRRVPPLVHRCSQLKSGIDWTRLKTPQVIPRDSNGFQRTPIQDQRRLCTHAKRPEVTCLPTVDQIPQRYLTFVPLDLRP